MKLDLDSPEKVDLIQELLVNYRKANEDVLKDPKVTEEDKTYIANENAMVDELLLTFRENAPAMFLN